MAVRIRLQRHGRKHRPFYYIVVADSRAPRDGRFVERIGSYNPMTEPATIQLDFDKALSWIQKGAQPSDTARSLLSKEGVLHYNHLLKGVTKGAFDEATAKQRFETWKSSKESRIETLSSKQIVKKEEEEAKRLEAERKVNEERANKIAEKVSALNAAAEEEAKAKEEVAEPTDEAVEPKAEESKN